ncbi:hypothetical protein [Methanogenium cariaci]|uniref:hypothetical protein n=1 Tax=Methanogenium cariaci TaxID=2197 RepID=UPI0007863C0D|nr:hypothetical protein [Methanogenium cariaci]
MLCNYVSKEFSFSTNSGFEDEIVNYPATIACYLVLKGIFNYSEGKYWNYVRDDIKEFNAAKGQMLGKAFLRFIEKNGLFHVEIPPVHKNMSLLSSCMELSRRNRCRNILKISSILW